MSPSAQNLTNDVYSVLMTNKVSKEHLSELLEFS